MRRLVQASAALALYVQCASIPAQPAQCRALESKRFGANPVKLVRSATAQASANVIVFKAPMAVNTDGAPTSYHPQDFVGRRLAINRLDNGISIRTLAGTRPSLQEQMSVVEQWRTSNWRVPRGFTIGWQNVIAATPAGKPCVFTQGDYQGYFGSLTALKNGLRAAQAGECAVNNQIDQRVVPTIALRGGVGNPMVAWGAKVGDLVVALNPSTGVVVSGVIGDSGNGRRIGEGSVAMNMGLLGRTEQTRTYAQTLTLDIAQDMVVAVLPATRRYALERPHTAESLARRTQAWAAQRYGSIEKMTAMLATCFT